MRCLILFFAAFVVLHVSTAMATDFHVPAHFEGNRWVPAVTYHDAAFRPSTPCGTPMAEALPDRDVFPVGSGGGLRYQQPSRNSRSVRPRHGF